MAQKDKIEKMLEEYDDVFADIVNVLGFQGKKEVRQNSLRPGPTASVYWDKQGEHREQFRDVAKYCMDMGTILVLFGLENQTVQDWDMVFRMMRYDGSAYKLQENRRKKYPVISFVLYFGMEHWEAPVTVHEAVSGKLPEWQRVLELVPDYRMNLIEVAFLPKEVREQFTSDFHLVAEYFYAKRTGREKEFFEGPEGRRHIRHVREVLEFFRIFSGDARYNAVLENYEKHAEEGERDMSCSLLDYVEGKGLSQGAKACVEICRELGQDYDSTLQRLMDKFSFSRNQAEDEMKKYWK